MHQIPPSYLLATHHLNAPTYSLHLPYHFSRTLLNQSQPDNVHNMNMQAGYPIFSLTHLFRRAHLRSYLLLLLLHKRKVVLRDVLVRKLKQATPGPIPYYILIFLSTLST